VARKRKSADPHPQFDGERQAEVRIIGGHFRGRKLSYHGDPVVRPMKHRTREAIFNLVGTGCQGRHVIDLFAGTGALGLEALSRGSDSATFIEKHVPSARIVEENIRTLEVENRAALLVTSAFVWGKRDLPTMNVTARGKPWLVFCSPPYAFFVERQEEMVDLIGRIQHSAPDDSILVVEAEEPFDFDVIRNAPATVSSGDWDIRSYSPAVVGIWHSR